MFFLMQNCFANLYKEYNFRLVAVTYLILFKLHVNPAVLLGKEHWALASRKLITSGKFGSPG